MLENGIIEPGEICPGVTYEQHAESLAMAMLTGTSYTQQQLDEVKQEYLLMLRNDEGLTEPE